ncbi:hypothetical protein FACS1894168_0300 [Deltaproteobacteria bacterium]|nr:hypothetical protein FACS1894168_0300 [Deltaproteobacteria bacterium]
MPSNGNLRALAERARTQTEQDAQEIESLTRKQFENLSASLSESSKAALSTTESVIRSGIADIEKSLTSRFLSLGDIFSRKYLLSILLSGGILATTLITCWGLMALYSYRITDLRQEIAGLQAAKEVWDRDFPPLQRAFSGLELLQDKGRNYLILPEGKKALSAGEVNNRVYLEIVRK